MRLIDSYRISKSNLFRSKARSMLTIFGVGVGVGAIVLLVSLGIGLEKLTTEKIASLDVLTTIDVSAKENSTSVLNESAVDKFSQISNVNQVSPSIKAAGQITYKSTTTSTLVYGIEEKNTELEGVAIESGDKNITGGRGIIISKSLLKTLGEEDYGAALNQEIELKIINSEGEKDSELDLAKEIDAKLNIVGVDKSESMGLVYVDLSWLKNKLEKKNFDAVKIKAKNRKSVAEIKKEIEAMNYGASTVSDLIAQVETIFLIVEIILGLIGGIGLFVAAIGIINTMTIALLERTHEIGVMKAIGASNSDVRKIFLSESIMISFFGGILGVIIGYGTGVLLNTIVNLLIKMSGSNQVMELFITPYLLSLGMIILTIFIGILTGLYPARRAAKLSPLEALHVE